MRKRVQHHKMCKFVKSETPSSKIEMLPWGVSDVTILHRSWCYTLYFFVQRWSNNTCLTVFFSDNDLLDINSAIRSTQWEIGVNNSNRRHEQRTSLIIYSSMPYTTYIDMLLLPGNCPANPCAKTSLGLAPSFNLFIYYFVLYTCQIIVWIKTN